MRKETSFRAANLIFIKIIIDQLVLHDFLIFINRVINMIGIQNAKNRKKSNILSKRKTKASNILIV